MAAKVGPASAFGTADVLSVAYRPFGPLQSLTYGNGLDLTRTYDGDYWLNQLEAVVALPPTASV